MATTAFRNLIKKIQEEHPVLPDKKIKELLVQYRATGDLEVRDQIILSNVGLAMKYVSQYQYVNDFLEPEDLFNETIEGLSVAIDKFDLEKDVKFTTYAAYWIKQRILRAISNTGNAIRIPVNIGESIRKARNYIKNTNEHVSVEKIMEETGVSKEAAEYALSSTDVLSLNAIVSNDSSEAELGDFIADDIDTEKVTQKNEMEAAVHDELLIRLNQKEQDIINMRFGLDGYLPMTLDEVANHFHLSRERIRQIEMRALKKLRRSSELRMFYN